MVAPLVVLLVGDAGLLEQVEVDEAAGQLAHVVEVDADELALRGGGGESWKKRRFCKGHLILTNFLT